MRSRACVSVPIDSDLERPPGGRAHASVHACDLERPGVARRARRLARACVRLPHAPAALIVIVTRHVSSPHEHFAHVGVQWSVGSASDPRSPDARRPVGQRGRGATSLGSKRECRIGNRRRRGGRGRRLGLGVGDAIGYYFFTGLVPASNDLVSTGLLSCNVYSKGYCTEL